MGEEVNIEELKKLIAQSKKVRDAVFSFVGYGEKTMPLLKMLSRNLNPDFWEGYFNYVFEQLDYKNGECILSAIDVDGAKFNRNEQYAQFQFVILYLDEDLINDFIAEWEPEGYLTLLIAILPKQEEKSNRRKKAIGNLHRLYEAGKGIYLIDEEKVESKEAIFQEISQFENSLVYYMSQELVTNIDFADFCHVVERGFIYYAEGENYQFEKAFDVHKFIQQSHLSDNVHVVIDEILLIIFMSQENELLLEYMEYMHDQFVLLNARNLKWGLGYKHDWENDNFHCYAHFSQDKFPEYLEEE